MFGIKHFNEIVPQLNNTELSTRPFSRDQDHDHVVETKTNTHDCSNKTNQYKVLFSRPRPKSRLFPQDRLRKKQYFLRKNDHQDFATNMYLSFAG